MMGTVLASNIYEILKSMRAQVLAEHLSAITGVAVSVAALFAAINLIKISGEYLEGQKGLSIWDVFRPLVLLVCVANFSFVSDATYSVTNIFSNGLGSGYSESIETYRAKMKELSHGRFEQVERDLGNLSIDLSDSSTDDQNGEIVGNNLDKEERGRFWKGFLKAMFKPFGPVKAVISVADLWKNADLLMAYFMYVLECLLMTVIHVECAIVLLFLSLIGPYVFAFSILTSYKLGIMNWFARYIQVSMWVPVTYILADACTTAGCFLCNGNGAWMLFVANLVGLLMMLRVKSFAGMVIDSAGDSDAVSARAMAGQTFGFVGGVVRLFVGTPGGGSGSGGSGSGSGSK